MKGSKSFRPYVPLVLNGRVFGYHFSANEPNIRMEILVRRYPSEGGSYPERVVIQFERALRTLYPDQSHTVFGERARSVHETYYNCTNRAIDFENETIPSIRS
jgi:hypothetical protein